uniref:Calmodulin n=1 Tax=Salix viminalis TaxID=40686 RepID=A0A6N2KLD6_SALVM
MVLKRAFQFDDGEDGFGMGGPAAQESKRFRNAVRDVMGRLSVNDFVSRMEPLLRAVVRDEVERTVLRVFQSSSRPSFNQNRTCGGLKLHFVNKLPSTIFTGGRIEAEYGNPVRVVLMDANTRAVVSSGPLASLKIEIVPLDADFGFDDEEDWSGGEFAASVVREREGRRPLVTGELTLTLRDGVGQLGDIVFTDNSSWQRSRKFRLGARPVQKVSDETRIREGRSEAFVVKDHRGELYKKHHPPHLGDEVWRLERIAKDGAFNKRLASYGVKSVQDFLQLYMIDPTMLRTVLGCGISNKIWDTIIEHANTCVLDGSRFYSYFDAGQSIGLLFDSIYKVVGAMFDGQNYEALHNLSPAKKNTALVSIDSVDYSSGFFYDYQFSTDISDVIDQLLCSIWQALVENVRWQAYKNLNSFIQVDSSNIFGPLRSLTTLPTEPFTRQDQPEMQMDFNNSCSSTSYGYDTEISSPLEVSGAQTSHQEALHQMFRNSFKFTDFLPLPCTEENSWPPKSWPVATGEQLSREDIPDVQAPTWSPGNSTWGTGSAFVFSAGDEGDPAFFSSYPSFGVHISHIRPPRARWCKLRAALKMGSFMRDIAARRMSQGLCM